MNFDHRKRFHTTGLCIAFSGKNNGIGFDRFDHRVWYHIVCTSLELVIVTAPAWSGVGFDAKENEYCTLDSGLSQVLVLGITMRCYQRGVGICFSSRRLNGFIIWPTLFFCCNCIFFSWLGMILTEYSSIIQGARSNAACKNQLLGTFVLPLNKPNVFFQPFRAVYR